MDVALVSRVLVSIIDEPFVNIALSFLCHLTHRLPLRIVIFILSDLSHLVHVYFINSLSPYSLLLFMCFPFSLRLVVSVPQVF